MTPDREQEPKSGRVRRIFSLLEKVARYCVVAFFLSFAVPALIVLAPDFGRIYLHVWKAALGIEPDCPQWHLRGFTCGAPADHPRADQEPIKREGKPPL
jgi:hypothetical protein